MVLIRLISYSLKRKCTSLIVDLSESKKTLSNQKGAQFNLYAYCHQNILRRPNLEQLETPVLIFFYGCAQMWKGFHVGNFYATLIK